MYGRLSSISGSLSRTLQVHRFRRASRGLSLCLSAGDWAIPHHKSAAIQHITPVHGTKVLTERFVRCITVARFGSKRPICECWSRCSDIGAETACVYGRWRESHDITPIPVVFLVIQRSFTLLYTIPCIQLYFTRSFTTYFNVHLYSFCVHVVLNTSTLVKQRRYQHSMCAEVEGARVQHLRTTACPAS